MTEKLMVLAAFACVIGIIFCVRRSMRWCGTCRYYCRNRFPVICETCRDQDKWAPIEGEE